MLLIFVFCCIAAMVFCILGILNLLSALGLVSFILAGIYLAAAFILYGLFIKDWGSLPRKEGFLKAIYWLCLIVTSILCGISMILALVGYRETAMPTMIGAVTFFVIGLIIDHKNHKSKALSQ